MAIQRNEGSLHRGNEGYDSFFLCYLGINPFIWYMIIFGFILKMSFFFVAEFFVIAMGIGLISSIPGHLFALIDFLYVKALISKNRHLEFEVIAKLEIHEKPNFHQRHFDKSQMVQILEINGKKLEKPIRVPSIQKISNDDTHGFLLTMPYLKSKYFVPAIIPIPELKKAS